LKEKLLVVSDSKVVIALAMTCHIDLEEKLFEEVIVPEAVWKEVTVEADFLPALKGKGYLREVHRFGEGSVASVVCPRKTVMNPAVHVAFET